MTKLWKTIIIVSLLASVSSYACEWKNKSKVQKTMAQITTETPQTYVSSWSDAKNSPLLQLTTTNKEMNQTDRNVAVNTK